MKHMLAKMIALAANAHKEQLDRGGQPYILHCMEVMRLLNTDDEELQCIAVGHDIIEDCCFDIMNKTMFQDEIYSTIKSAEFVLNEAARCWMEKFLLREGFTGRIVSGISALTKLDNMSIIEYKASVKGNADAIRVKMCDLIHNSDIRRIKGLSDKDFKRTIMYQEFYNELKELIGGGRR